MEFHNVCALTITLYTPTLGEIIRKHSINFYYYGDDTQLHLSMKPMKPISYPNFKPALRK